MSTLAQLKTKLSRALGTTELVRFTTDNRTAAINTAIENVLEMYLVPQYLTTGTVTFSAGIGTMPTDCLRPVRLFQADSSTSQLTRDYLLINQNDFDLHLSNTYTTKYISGVEKLYIFPADTVSLSFRYLMAPTYLSSDSDTTQFVTRWDDAIVQLAASYLFSDDNQAERSASKYQLAMDLLAKVWQAENARFESPETNRVESVHAKRGILSGGDNLFNNSGSMNTTSSPTWLTVSTTTYSPLAGYGYIPTSASQTVFTLPAIASVGDTITISGQGAGGWRMAQNAGQYMVCNSSTTTTGVTGYVESTLDTDVVTFICETANLGWKAIVESGNVTIA